MITIFYISLLVVFASADTLQGNTTGTTSSTGSTGSTGCTSKDGKQIKVGETYASDPCKPCYCSEGDRLICSDIFCMAPVCVDSVHKPDDCCPVCPNGPNCRAPNGQIIKEGEMITMSDGYSCSCEYDMFSGFLRPFCVLPV